MKLMFEILNEMSIHVKNFMGISHDIYIKLTWCLYHILWFKIDYVYFTQI